MNILDEILAKAKLLKDAREKATQRDGGWYVEDGTYPDRYGTSNAIGTNVCVYSQADAQFTVLAANETAFLVAAVEHLCEENKKLKWALDRISRTSCTAHPSDLKQYRRETALAALTAARESEAQFEKQWGKK